METIFFAYSIRPSDILETEFIAPLGLSSYRLAMVKPRAQAA
jgi:plasmid maintenance system antidote protein VapI